MPPPAKRSFWQKIRRPLRWCRICLLSLAFAILGGFIYFNTIGLPDFVKSRLVAKLQARGVDLAFTRLRLRWYRGLVADSVTLAGKEYAESTQFSAREVALKPDWAALRRFRFEITSLIIRDGYLRIPLVSTNEPTVSFAVDRIQTELRLLPGDRWELDRFEADSLGARVNLEGILTNASLIRNWQAAKRTNQAALAWQNYMRQAAKFAGQLRFSQPPQARLAMRGDARDPSSITAELSLDARNADTSWGKFEKLLLIAKLNRPAAGRSEGQSELKLVVDETRTPWIEVRQSRFQLRWAQSLTNPMPAEINWNWEFDRVRTPWGTIPNARFTGQTIRSDDNPPLMKTELTLDSGTLRSQWVVFETNRFTARMSHTPTTLVPLRADWEWTVATPESRWGNARLFEFTGRLTRSPTNATPRANADWAWWSLLEPYAVDWSARLGSVTLTNILLDEVSMTGQWRAPDVAVDHLHASVAGRSLDGSASVNVGTRRLQAQCNFDFDLRQLFPLLEPTTRQWTEPVRWRTPPKMTAHAACTLPAWTNSNPNLKLEVVPTLEVAGTLDAGESGFRNLSFDSVRSHFHYSNGVVRLPDLTVMRPEGRAEFDFTSNLEHGRYYCKVQSGIDPLALRSLLEGKDSPVLDLFQFPRPPRVEGEFWGGWPAAEETGVIARVRATNVVFRGETFDEFSASFQFTNRFLLAADVNVRSGNESVSGPGVGFDLATGMLFLTNAVSTMDPQRILRCINPVLATNLSRYTFKQPPQARINGWIEVRQGRVSDLRIDLSGGPFNYWKFNAPQVSGAVLLVNEHVTITNLAADFYGGKLTGNIAVSSTATPNPDIRLALETTDTDLHQLMTDIWSPTNRLEGILSGELTVTKANAGDWGSWNGFGNARLRNGYLWDIPLFGIFSPVLNAIVPGLGQSRVSAAAAGFFITNSVIHTRDLAIHSPAMRLAYRGTIDFNYRVDARVEARLLHDIWVVGPLVSLVFSPLTKLLEYKITGTLNEPRLEPLFIPKPLLFPLHPWRTLKELFTDEKPDKPSEGEKPPP